MSAQDMNRDNIRGGFLMAAAMAGFAAEDALIKGLTNSVPTGQLVFLIGALGAVAMAVIAKMKGAAIFSRRLLRKSIWLRSLGEFVSGIAFVTALSLMPLSMASAILQTLPLAMTAGAAIFLSEKVGWRRWSAILVGFAGVLIVLRPTGEGFNLLAAGAAFLTVAGLALRDLATRQIPKDIDSLSLSVWGMATYAVAGMVLMLIGRQTPIAMDAGTSGLIVAAVIFGLIGYYLMIVATRIGEISAIMPYRYARLLCALVLGWIFFAETPDAIMLFGCALIVGSGLYTFLRERYHAFHSKPNPLKGA